MPEILFSQNKIAIDILEINYTETNSWKKFAGIRVQIVQKKCRDKGGFAGIRENALIENLTDSFQKSAGIRGCLPG